MLTIQCFQEEGKVLIQPTGELTIYTVGQAKQDLMNAFEGHAELELDLGGIEEIDSAGVQLLYWFKQLVLQRGRPLPITGHGAAVVEAFGLLNLVERFGDPILPSSHTR
ncbi:MAG: STAS domain-containing protein [Acidobacteria bacterium]|nr:STAS domain-containing protein [Acidobacteriota bacterium]MBI3487133.1 STAS domain-containing protein [Acidobacteriota bacterium]